MEDAEIVGLFWKRDEQAIAEFEKSHKRMCVSAALEITGSISDAEECYSDTCLAVWNSIPPKRPDSLKAYALKICRNFSLNCVKTKNTQKRSAILVELDECVSDRLSDSLEEADSREIGRAIDEFLEGLPKADAAIFVRRYYFSEAVRDIAKKTGKTENQVSKILSRLRKRLRKHLDERGIGV
ncbi:MAG: RNA polymerase sigma factor [Eubacteriales bacterium]